MEQLKMFWKNDGLPAKVPVCPEGVGIISLPDMENGVEHWLDIMQYGLSAKRENYDYYKDVMFGHPGYKESDCFFITVSGDPAASVAVICDGEKQGEGYIHMVACKEEYRGRGLSHVMNDLCLYELKRRNQKTAYLTTDDWRIPAIKGYLKMGFMPDLSTEDFKARWEAIYEIIESGKTVKNKPE